MTISGGTGNGTYIQAAVSKGTAAHRVMNIDTSGDLKLENLTIRNGVSAFGSGAVRIAGGARVLIIDSVVMDNQAATVGGAINVVAGEFTMVNSTVSGNSAEGNGGGIFVLAGTKAHLYNVTVSNNVTDSDDTSGGDCGGLRNNAAAADFTVHNSIIAGNVDGSSMGTDAPDCSSILGFTSQGNNLIGINTSCAGFTNAVSGDQVGTSGSPVDPLLSVLSNAWGGPTSTHALTISSPSKNAGDAGGCEYDDDFGGSNPDVALALDQRQVIRPATGTACDIGALELQDNDSDGIPDGGVDGDDDEDTMTYFYENNNGLNPLVNDAAGDLGLDGLTNLEEFNLGTAANDPDTDGDSIRDNLDPEPLVGPNHCTGASATMSDPVIVGTFVCGAATKITVNPVPSLTVQAGAYLYLISPTVEIKPGFNVLFSGMLGIISEDPTPSGP